MLLLAVLLSSGSKVEATLSLRSKPLREWFSKFWCFNFSCKLG